MKELIKEHIKELIKGLKQWEKYEKIDKNKFLSDEDTQNMVMYGMLRTIQSMIDIGNDIIEIFNFEEPSTYKEIFEILKKHNIIDEELSEELKKLAGFRNVLVHIYYDIDLNKVYEVLISGRNNIEKFLRIVLDLTEKYNI
ncbi:DUF86 domain-containing protein [Nanoarchaeota archaeon]